MSKELNSTQITLDPFEGIGLCFSGGGYRATFYSLGVVSYLNSVLFKDKPLLEHVNALSSVSGGTLLAVAYAKFAQQSDPDFIVFFNKFYTAFEPKNDKLLDTAINKLESADVWAENPYKSRSLINAFALAYAEMDIFKGDFLMFQNPISTHLKEVCFNATDFSYGLTYRFQNTGDFGNEPLSTPAQVNELRFKVQLGDVVASSSCFPIGFEPLVFPNDYFNHQDPNYIKLKKNEKFKYGVGIMDGGIADNQGIASMILISKRTDTPLNLIMVNDVSSFKMVPWQKDSDHVKMGSSLRKFTTRILRYFKVKPLYWILFLVGLLLVVLNSLGVFTNCNECGSATIQTIGSILIGIGITLTLLGAFASLSIKFLKSKLNALFKNSIPKPLVDDVLSFQKLDIGLIQQMLTNRLTSSSKMINDVFLKQMRRLNYRLLYSNSSLKNKLVTTTVYELNGQQTPYTGNKFSYNKAIQPAPSKILTDVGFTASETPTTLWWDKEDIEKNRMDTLIACGQFTVCYELINYILDLKKQKKELKIDIKEIDLIEMDKLLKQLLTDWKKFNNDPFFLLKNLKEVHKKSNSPS